MAKKRNRKDGLTFTTGDAPADNPFAALSGLSGLPQAPENLPPYDEGADAGAVPKGERANVRLRVLIDRKYRRGKEVTLITGFTGPGEEIERLTKLIKTKCGVGGSAKGGEIIIQGNKRDEALDLLHGEGYTGAKPSGG